MTSFDNFIQIKIAVGTIASMRNLLPFRKEELATRLAAELGAESGDDKYDMTEIQAGLRKVSAGEAHHYFDKLSDAEQSNVRANCREWHAIEVANA